LTAIAPRADEATAIPSRGAVPECREMGWSICVATERDPERVTWLSRHFSYELLRPSGCLRAFITEPEARLLGTDAVDDPSTWEARDPAAIRAILERVRDRLHEENERLPVHHFLWFVDEDGERCGGGTQITIPFGGIELKYPHDPIVKLDGGHGDIHHRQELKTFRVRVDPVKLEEIKAQALGRVAELGLEGEVSVSMYNPPNPLVDEPDGWIPAAPVLDILGHRVEVQSEDALAMLEPDLAEAIACCDRAKSEGLPLFWLSG
jgi:hypothetical protein